MKYEFVQAQQGQHRIGRLCQVLAVIRSGYYAWRHRPMSPRARANARLVERMTHLHRQMKERYGAIKRWWRKASPVDAIGSRGCADSRGSWHDACAASV